MKVHVLDSAIGGGFSQRNCNYSSCNTWRQGSPRFTARIQSSITVSGDAHNWVLFNTFPGIP